MSNSPWHQQHLFPAHGAEQLSRHDLVERSTLQRKQDQQKRALERAEAQARKRAKMHMAQARRNVKLELDRVRVLQTTLVARLDRAKLSANDIATDFKRVVNEYVALNAMRPEDIGWAGDLQERMSVLPGHLTPKVVKNPTTSRVRQALRKATTNPSNHAWSTKNFGASSHASALFAGEPGVALGFSIGKEPQVLDNSVHVGLSFGPDFAYTTSNEASDGTTSSEHIKARLFRKLGLVRYRIDAAKILSATMQSALRNLNADEHGDLHWHVPIETWGRPNREGVVGDPDFGYASGIYFGVYRYTRRDTNERDTRVIIGYWGLVGMRLDEIKAASYDAFEVTDKNADDLGSSCLMNLLRSGDPMLEHREFSLRSAPATEHQPSILVKNSMGYFIVAEQIDRRHEFEYFKVTGTLPKDLNEDYVGSSDLLHRYAGRTVYVDFASKMIHYYTGGGNLRVRMFNDAAPLNEYDYVDLHSRGIALTQSDVLEAKSSALAESAVRPHSHPDVVFDDIDWSRLKDDVAVESVCMARKEVPDAFNVSVEMLRRSYNNEKILYNLVLNYFRILAKEKAVDLARGYSFIGESDDENLEALANRMIMPQIRVMLMAASMSEREFPTMESAKTAVAAHQEGLQNPKLDMKFQGIGSYLNENGQAELYKTQPHQVRALGMAAVAKTGVWDIDMGGGKTLLSILLNIFWIEQMLASGDKPRCAVVMPDQLITNFYREIKKFTRRDPLHPEAGSRMNVITLRSKNAKMTKAFTQNEIMDAIAAAPVNTLVLVSYSWLSADPVKINTGEYRTSSSGERVYKYEYMFPRAEALIQRAGVNAVILDESHKIKNNGSDKGFAHKACMALSRVPYKFLMTGTFISKNPQDVFNQVKFINPTMLGSIADFRKRYTLENGAWNHETLKDLRRYIASRGVITMRREEWLYQMPQKIESFHFPDFMEETPKIYEIYKALWEATNKEFPAEFAEMLGGGRVRVDHQATVALIDDEDDSTLDALDLAEEAVAEEKAIKDLNPEDLVDASAEAADSIIKSPVSARLQALRALVSAPERLPAFTEAMKKASSIVKFDANVLMKGPKDRILLDLVRKHFEATNGSYVPPSQQDGPDENKVGKIAIVCDRVLIAQHALRVLKEAGIAGVAYYDAGHRENLDAFCDPENTDISIMCMVENSVREGVNGQAISRIIKLTIPWTTGDYDQVIARMFRLGQRKNVYVDNVLCARSFEVAQLARLISRENVNRKVNSDFDTSEWMEEITINPEIAHPETGLIFERDLTNYQYGPEDGKRTVNLLKLHEEIYQYELRRSVAWRASYMLHLCDSVEMMERNPERYLYKHTDRRKDIKDSIPGVGHPFGCPAEVYYAENHELENQIVYVDAERRIGILYLRSSKDENKLEYVRIRFYELEAWNQCATDSDIADCHDVYEPWPTHGIAIEEMAVPEVDVVEPEQVESRNEREMRGIGQTGFEETLKQTIIRELRNAATQCVDENLTTFLMSHILTSESKLVTTIYNAVADGVFDQVLLQSPGVKHVYEMVSGNKLITTDSSLAIQMSVRNAARKLRDTKRAKEQARTGQPVPEPAPGLGTGDRVIPGPVIRAPQETDGYSVGFGQLNGKFAFVIPQHTRNRELGAPVSAPGFHRAPARMLYQINSEAQLKAMVDSILRVGVMINNLELLSSAAFKFELARCLGSNTPDQTASLSLLSMFATASAGISLDYVVVEKTMLITTGTQQRDQLIAAGFRDMPPYLYSYVTADTVGSVMARMTGVRNRTALASRVYSMLRVRPRAATHTDR